MAVKTITIDMEAYERLSRLKEGKKSFSQVIKEYLPASGSTAGDLLVKLARTDISESTLRAVETTIDERRANPVRVPRW